MEVVKVGRKKYDIWNHNYSESIHVDTNHTDSNQPIPDNSKNIGSIHNLANICAIEKMLTSSVHLLHTPSPVTDPPIFVYGTVSDPRSPPHDISAESMKHKVNPTPHNNPLNMVAKLPSDPDSDPSLSYSSSSGSSISSKSRGQCLRKNKNKCRSKTHLGELIKKCAILTDKILTAAYKSEAIRFKFENMFETILCRFLMAKVRP